MRPLYHAGMKILKLNDKKREPLEITVVDKDGDKLCDICQSSEANATLFES